MGIIIEWARWLAILILTTLNADTYSPWEAKVVEVLGADEIRVQTEAGPVVVRMYGIDAPIWWDTSPAKAESKENLQYNSRKTVSSPEPLGSPIPQLAGKEARQYTSNRTLGKTVRIQPIPGRFEGSWYNPTIHRLDAYNRIQAIVWVTGEHRESLNKELLRKGWAWWYEPYFPFERGFKHLQDVAKSKNIGIWAYPDPIPPWEWQARAFGKDPSQMGWSLPAIHVYLTALVFAVMALLIICWMKIFMKFPRQIISRHEMRQQSLCKHTL